MALPIRRVKRPNGFMACQECLRWLKNTKKELGGMALLTSEPPFKARSQLWKC